MADSEVELWSWAVTLPSLLVAILLRCGYNPNTVHTASVPASQFQPAITPVSLRRNTGRYRWEHSKRRFKSDILLCPEVEFYSQTDQWLLNVHGS